MKSLPTQLQMESDSDSDDLDDFQVDGKFIVLLEIKNEFEMTQREFFSVIEPNKEFVDNKGVTHILNWMRPYFQKIWKEKDVNKRLEILESKGYMYDEEREETTKEKMTRLFRHFGLIPSPFMLEQQ